MTVETLGDALRARWALTVRCAQGNRDGLKSIRQCLQSEKVDLASIVWTRGRNFPIAGLSERLMCPACGSRKVTVAFSPPAPGGTEAEALADVRGQRVGDMNFTIEEWEGGRLRRVLAGSPDLHVALAAFAAAVKVTRKSLGDRPELSIEMKHGSRLMERFPPKEAGERAAPAAE